MIEKFNLIVLALTALLTTFNLINLVRILMAIKFIKLNNEVIKINNEVLLTRLQNLANKESTSNDN